MSFEKLAGTTLYKPEKCYNGYTLWCGLPKVTEGADKEWEKHGTCYLINMKGDVVHKWDLPFPSSHCQLLPDGHLLCGLVTSEKAPGRPGQPPYFMGGVQGILAELDWDGKVVFWHKDLTLHHDFKKLPNGNYMLLTWEPVKKEIAAKVRGGMKGREHADGTMFTDVYREIDPKGNVVWEWHSVDHLDFDKDIIGSIHTREEWSHMNDLWVCPNGDIVSSCRHLDSVLRVSRETGEIIWRWGSPSYLDEDGVQRTDKPDTLGGPHDAHIIPEGLPGAGHMLCFDNGMYKYISRALEVDVETGEIVWESKGTAGFSHGRISFSPHISGARRQPNGNTVICEGNNGHFYELTHDLEMVWEYWRPEKDDSPDSWSVFRCYRYGKDYCPQFKDLPPAEGEAI